MKKLTSQEMKQLAQELNAAAEAKESEADAPVWFDGQKVDQVAYCEQLLAKQEMKCINKQLYTIDGFVDDDTMAAQIAADLKPYVRTSLNRNAIAVLETLKMLCQSEPIMPKMDRIHFRNGTYFLNTGYFSPDKEWTMNRLPVEYDPKAPRAIRWTQFMEELLHKDDIPTLQEYMGYMLIPSNKGQALMLLFGSGGEGKSRIGALLQTMFGSNVVIGDVSKLETNKFYPATLEGKLLFIDDDMDLGALKSTNVIKVTTTCEGFMALEKKGKQSYQGLMYARLLCMGNGTLKALHDKTVGFYRRQLIIQTKNKPKDRVDDPYLKEKLEDEIPSIILWALEGLQRLIQNDFHFTVSERSKRLKKELMDADNNIVAFLEDTAYVMFDANEKCTTRKLYDVYKRWCYDNAEIVIASTTFNKYLAQNAEALKIKPNKNVAFDHARYARGYDGIKTVIDGFHQYRDDDPDPDCPFNQTDKDDQIGM